MMDAIPRPLHRMSISWSLAALCWVTTFGAQAQPPQASPRQTQQILADFEEEMRQIDGLLTEGQPRRAYRRADQLLEDMANRFMFGPSVGRFLGIATVLKAIAAYQLGEEAEALWHWHVACQLWPSAKNLKMTAYGDAGPFLKSHPPREPTEPVEQSEPAEPTEPAEKPEWEVKMPRKKIAPRPEFPAARRGESVSVDVQIVIGKDGRPRSPKIIESKGELTMVYMSLDALRRWEFKPATLNGEPVDVYYNLTVNFGRRR